MIRRTVARAFGSPGDERTPVEKAIPPGPRGSRVQLLNAFFTELQEALERAVSERSGGAPVEGAAAAGYRMTKARPRPEGIECIVEAPPGTRRLLNAMDGMVWIFRDAGGRFEEERVVSIGFEGGRPRVMEKAVGVSRAPFRFTSVPQLVKDLLGP